MQAQSEAAVTFVELLRPVQACEQLCCVMRTCHICVTVCGALHTHWRQSG